MPKRHKPVRRRASSAPNRKSSRGAIIILLSILIFLIGIASVIYFSKTPFSLRFPFAKKQQLAQTIVPGVPTPTPTPIKLHGGKGAYAISQGEHKGPDITMVTLDPLDVKKGETLTVTVKIQSTSPIKSSEIRLETDGASVKLPLQKFSENGITQEWQGQTTLTDSLWYRYVVHATATDSTGTNTVVVAPRGD